MVKRCAAVNVEIIVDVVLNHMAAGVHRKLAAKDVPLVMGMRRAHVVQSLVAIMIGMSR